MREKKINEAGEGHKVEASNIRGRVKDNMAGSKSGLTLVRKGKDRVRG